MSVMYYSILTPETRAFLVDWEARVCELKSRREARWKAWKEEQEKMLENLCLPISGAGFSRIAVPESPRMAIARRAPVAEVAAESHASCSRALADLNRSVLEGTDFRYARSISRITVSILQLPVFSHSTTVKTYRQ